MCFLPRPGVLSNPLNRVVFGNKPLNDFRFPIGPQDIDSPAGTGIFSGQERRLLFQHHSTMRLRRLGSSQPCCHNGLSLFGEKGYGQRSTVQALKPAVALGGSNESGTFTRMKQAGERSVRLTRALCETPESKGGRFTLRPPCRKIHTG